MKQSSLVMAIIVVGLLGSQNTLVAQHEQHQQQQSTQAHEQAKEVYTCPMHPDVVSDKPGKCPKCGMKLVKTTQETGRQEATGQAKTISEIAPKAHQPLAEMGKPTFEQSVKGYRLQVWLITQEEHKKIMSSRMQDTSRHEIMEHKMPEKEMKHDMEGMMGKGMKHNQAGKESKGMIEAMLSGTHHIMAVLTDEKANTPAEGASAKVEVLSPSKKIETSKLFEMMNHFGGGIKLEENGLYALTVRWKVGDNEYKTTFTYQNN